MSMCACVRARACVCARARAGVCVCVCVGVCDHRPAVVQHDFGALATSIGRWQLQATYSKL